METKLAAQGIVEPNRTTQGGSERIKLPRMFFDDHCQRFENFPQPVNESARYVWIDDTDPYLPNLIDDARHYADVYGPDAAPQFKAAANRLLAALSKARGER